MTFNRLKKITHKTFAGFMAIWLSGVVFLICCHAQKANAAEMEFCPLAKSGVHCNKSDQNIESLKLTKQSGESGMDCCAFIPALFDKTRKIDNDQQTAAVAPVLSVITPKLVSVAANFAPARPYLSAVLQKNSTFLKNRTFRI